MSSAKPMNKKKRSYHTALSSFVREFDPLANDDAEDDEEKYNAAMPTPNDQNKRMRIDDSNTPLVPEVFRQSEGGYDLPTPPILDSPYIGKNVNSSPSYPSSSSTGLTPFLTPISNLMQELNNDLAPPPTNIQTALQSPPPTPLNTTSILTIIEGLKADGESADDECSSQPGGKGNKKPLPRHVIAVNRSLLPPEYIQSALLLECGLEAYEREASFNTKSVIEVLKSVKVSPSENQVSFTEIVLEKSTHFFGRKPFNLLFTLRAMDGVELSNVGTVPFQTITDRGNQKRSNKKQEKKADPQVIELKPNSCSIRGNELVKVFVKNMPLGVKHKQIAVNFGNTSARVYACVHDLSMIICEAPASTTTRPNQVPVSLSFDRGKTFIEDDHPQLFSYSGK